jgi:hypothetical protein
MTPTRSLGVSDIGSIARVRKPQDVGLLTEEGLPTCPFQSARLTPEIPFLVEDRRGKALYIRLLAGTHDRRLAALSQQDLEVLQARPEGLLVA